MGGAIRKAANFNAHEYTKECLDGAAALKKTEKSRKCELDAEIGRCRVENGSEIIGASKPKERARSRAFTELCLMFAGSMSHGNQPLVKIDGIF